MADTYTTSLLLRKPETNAHQNAWGDLVSEDFGSDRLEQAIVGVESYTLSDDKTLTRTNGETDEARMRVQNITSADDSYTITIPSVAIWYLFRNASAHDQTVSNGTNSVTIKAGNAVVVHSDGTNIYLHRVLDYGADLLSSSGTPTDDAHIANKKYVDDAIDTAKTDLSASVEASETAAASSASDAAASATAAAASATEAAGYASDASDQVTLATAQVTLAEAQATAAASSATDAETAQAAAEAAQAAAEAAMLPSQPGNSGKFLTTDGSDPSWGDVLTVDFQEFTSSGTWNKPEGATMVLVELWGAGGGGGSGRRGPASSARNGGSGGGGGGYNYQWFKSSDLGDSETVTIGAGGTGGASQTGSSANGNDGNAGGDTTFGSLLTAKGGLGGDGGDNDASGTLNVYGGSGLTAYQTTAMGQGFSADQPLNQRGADGDASVFGGGGGGAGNTANFDVGKKGGSSSFGGGGGGGGASLNTSNIAAVGGDGGGHGNNASVVGGGGSGGTSSSGSTNGGAGSAGDDFEGGGGGGSSESGAGGAGGAGGIAGGGGGGAAAAAFSGKGGNGGKGFCRVTAW